MTISEKIGKKRAKTIPEKIEEKKRRSPQHKSGSAKSKTKSANIAVSLTRWKVWKLKPC